MGSMNICGLSFGPLQRHEAIQSLDNFTITHLLDVSPLFNMPNASAAELR